MMGRFLCFLAIALLSMQWNVAAFVPHSMLTKNSRSSPFVVKKQHEQQPHDYYSSSSSLNMMDPSMLMETTSSNFMSLQESLFNNNNLLLSFVDQGQNLAGIFFQASLLPYLVFLYFLSFRANRIPSLGNFGFQFVLLFVLSTIPSGIISKSVYECSLADVDWLHGGAEALLTLANILIVLGFRNAMADARPLTSDNDDISQGRNIALATFGVFAAACALGPSVGFGAHAPFLLGLGNFPQDMVYALPWVQHTEPINALSFPTWTIHFSSVFEYIFAMNLIWQFGKVTGNPRWKGLTWGMLPLHASGVCACTYHFFYNAPTLQFLVTTQAGLTLLGNLTLALAAFRIAQSNGWTLEELNPFPRSDTDPRGLVADGVAAASFPPALASDDVRLESNTVLAAKLIGITVFASYLVKYGELGLDVPFLASAPLAGAMIVGFPALTALYFASLSRKEDASDNSIFSFLPTKFDELSMTDVKKYGTAGIIAYILTEFAFWIVAFPAAAFALYQSTGHWPDILTDNTDRAAVAAFLFAGANIARAFVPLRLGAALALAPWVDENITGREEKVQS